MKSTFSLRLGTSLVVTGLAFLAGITDAGVATGASAISKPAAAKAAHGSEAQDPFAVVKDFQADGVQVQLLEVKRTSGDTVTVRWQYRNTTNEKKQLTEQRTGWIDPYRLSFEAYVLDNANQTKYSVATDADRHPIAARHGTQNSYIYLEPRQILKTWAKFQSPPETVDKVTISIPGVDPWEDVPISK